MKTELLNVTVGEVMQKIEQQLDAELAHLKTAVLNGEGETVRESWGKFYKLFNEVEALKQRANAAIKAPKKKTL